MAKIVIIDRKLTRRKFECEDLLAAWLIVISLVQQSAFQISLVATMTQQDSNQSAISECESVGDRYVIDLRFGRNQRQNGKMHVRESRTRPHGIALNLFGSVLLHIKAFAIADGAAESYSDDLKWPR